MNDDSLFEEAQISFGRVLRWVASLAFCTGMLAGAGEAILKIGRLDLLMHTTELWMLSLTGIVLDGALAGVVALPASLVALLLTRHSPPWKNVGAAFTLTITSCAMLFLVPLAREASTFEDHTRMGAVAMLTVSLPVTTWFNAGYWFRRTLIGAGPAVGWRGIATLSSLLIALVSPLAYAIPTPPPGIDSSSPNLILLTVDTLRRDHLGIYGGAVSTPTLDKLGTEGLIFEDVITPLPETAPSHATMFTGHHPAEHHVTSNGRPLTPGKTTLAEHLGVLGYRTAAFVSSFAVDSSSGLAQGFAVYDDDFAPSLRGVTELQMAYWGLRLLMRFGNPADYPFLLEREAPRTIERALSWVQSESTPMFLWVHLFEPHSPYQRHDGQPDAVDHKRILAQEPGYSYSPSEIAGLKDQYRMEVEYVDTQIKDLLDGLRAAGKLENAVVMVVGDHGESLGEHEIYFNHHGLYDTVLEVPMLLWTSHPAWTPGQRIRGQASVIDVANTLLSAGGQPLFSGTRSESLIARAMGAEIKPEAALLMGREGISLSEGLLLGVRSSNGIKYIQHPDQSEEFIDLLTDPGEVNNVADQQEKGVSIGRQNVEAIRKGMERGHSSEIDPETNAMLRSLGYLQ